MNNTISLLSRQYITSRKTYKCHWCGEQINSNSHYTRERVKYGKEFQTSVFHDECNEALMNDDSVVAGWEPFVHKRPDVGKLTYTACISG